MTNDKMALLRGPQKPRTRTVYWLPWIVEDNVKSGETETILSRARINRVRVLRTGMYIVEKTVWKWNSKAIACPFFQ